MSVFPCWGLVASCALVLSAGPTTAGEERLISQGVIDAPVQTVWDAFVTKAGQESWNVAHAEIDLRVGGKMRTHYDPKGVLGDDGTIENAILSLDPGRMISIRVTKAPKKFPFPNAIQSVWTVIYFEEAGLGKTRITVVGLGYATDDESKKMRSFFQKGNDFTLKKLKEKLERK
jgi:uncharacterized protein YndB with AHSA1/START domain